MYRPISEPDHGIDLPLPLSPPAYRVGVCWLCAGTKWIEAETGGSRRCWVCAGTGQLEYEVRA